MISVRNVGYTYMRGTPFEKTALKNISFDVADGEVVAIAGHTGSGKSTLIQLMAGLIDLQSGAIEIDGLSVADGAIRRKVGIVFQYPEHQLFEETVGDDIAFSPRNFGLSDEEISARVTEAMRQVGLDAALKSSSPFELSGGQRRRVAIAGILAFKPKYLILDEPTAGLDPPAKENLLRNLFDKPRATIILVSHNMDDIARLADRVIVLAQGENIFTGTPRQLFARQEILRRAGLEPPPVMKLLHALGIDAVALTADEAEKIIARNHLPHPLNQPITRPPKDGRSPELDA
ncbi:MAG: energy-coupling factor transporter ATPase [Quinella sp. 2Q5]|nr:energy-coupling factor transporter ATPase [Quinella sp. 2Q5]